MPSWLNDPLIRPYALVRPENQPARPGQAVDHGWFTREPLILNPLHGDQVPFAEALLKLDARAYAVSNMGMPRWVFYDCAAMPGVVSGFALHRSKATPELLNLLEPAPGLEWLPLSTFVSIPAANPREWVAHSLASVNPALPRGQSIKALGFLSKAFGLWWANVTELCGVAQWGSPALKLHAQFGDLEVLSAWAPLHSHAATLTYRVQLDHARWPRYFAGEPAPDFAGAHVDAGFTIDPKDAESLKSFQRRLEPRRARYYLNANQIRTQALDAVLNVYKRTHSEG